MRRAAPSRSFIPEEPFRLVGGHVAADLVNTVNWETQGPDRDRLSNYARVVEWAQVVGAIERPVAARLLAAAGAQRADADAAYEAARWLRDVLQRLLTAVGQGALDTPQGARAVGDFNAVLAAALRPLQVGNPRVRSSARSAVADTEPSGGALAWRWEGAEGRLDAVLWPVVCAAARLLTSPDAAQVRVCDGRDCGWIYVDRSRNGLRRWCEMETCGTLEKSRRRAERQRSHL